MHQRRIAEPQGDGRPYREHLQAVAARGHAAAKAELAGPELPPMGAYVWTWFLELHAARGSSGFGPLPIGYGEIAAWAALTGRAPLPWEIELLTALDRIWRSPPEKEP